MPNANVCIGRRGIVVITIIINYAARIIVRRAEVRMKGAAA